MLTQPEIGQRWKAAREAAGLSVTDAAEMVKCHRNTIYGVEKGDDGVTLRMMRTLATIYGVTLDDVFREDQGVGRVPPEFRPLLEPLMHMSVPEREDLLKNVASNLMFMGRAFAKQATYRPPPTTGTANKDVADVPFV